MVGSMQGIGHPDVAGSISINRDMDKVYRFLEAEAFVHDEEDFEALKRAANWKEFTKVELLEMVRWQWAESYDRKSL